jgi:predicted transposase/invertase (TIGR01784 family)
VEKGIEKGKKEGKLEMAKNLKRSGVDIDIIVKSSGLSKEEIEEL